MLIDNKEYYTCMQIPGSEQWADGPGLRALEPTCSHSFEPVLTRAALVGSLNTLSLSLMG
jgi:hypothetical protein